MKCLGIFAAFGVSLAMSCASDRNASRPQNASSAPAALLEPKVMQLSEAPAARPKAGSPAEIRHLAQGKNAFLGHLVLGPGMKVSVHRDPTEEYLYILTGAGTLFIDGKAYEIRAGHAVFMPANAEVHFQNGPEELRAIQVFAGPEPAKKYDKWVPDNG